MLQLVQEIIIKPLIKIKEEEARKLDYLIKLVEGGGHLSLLGELILYMENAVL
jgi:hypothetical protein